MTYENEILSVNGSYGGSQKWFTRPMMKLGGCSTVCACHAACELARKHGKAALYPFETKDLTLRQFRSFGTQMYKYVYPGFRGMPETRLFVRAFSDWCEHCGETVGFDTLEGGAPYEAAENFIREHIERGISVQYLLLEHENNGIDDIEWHWFTVTGFSDDNDFEIVYSTWGERRIASLELLWNTGKEEKGGLVAIL